MSESMVLKFLIEFNYLPVYRKVSNFFFQAKLDGLAVIPMNRHIQLQVREIIDELAKK